MKLDYQIAELVPYINWAYFYHAWGLSGKPLAEKVKLQKEARRMLDSLQGDSCTHALYDLFEAESDGDDLLLYKMPQDDSLGMFPDKQVFRFPMLRQQHPTAPGEPNLCLADFILPRGQKPKVDDGKGVANHVGVFCTTVETGILENYRHDEYFCMMAQTLCDRLAEATAEKLHEQVRREIWGYVQAEHLTIEQQHREEYQGIRPAIGYPSLPDTSANFIIDQLLDMKQVGIRLTETGMMTPHASVSGLMFAHPLARYFELGKIGIDQLRDYAHRRGVPVELMRRFLQSSLMKTS